MEWQSGSTVLDRSAIVRSTPFIGGVLAFYVAYVWVNWGLNRKPTAPTWLRVLYNLSVSALSLVYFVRLTVAVYKYSDIKHYDDSGNTLYDITCNAHGVSGTLSDLYEMNVLTRIVEFTDTVLIVHSSHPLSFLHCWHHVATLALSHLQVIDGTPAQWITLILNSSVHVIMYFYYALVALGQRPRWKSLITIAQIAQFVIILGAYGVMFTARYVGKFVCYASPRATVAGFFVIGSYLVLFVRFYFNTYGASTKKAKTM